MKIMICDDEMYIRDTLKQRLKEYYSSLDVLILSASSGEDTENYLLSSGETTYRRDSRLLSK